jgi:hypothetical protein
LASDFGETAARSGGSLGCLLGFHAFESSS